jgi:alpha-tubulin suppressor-like RCC1 family protein
MRRAVYAVGVLVATLVLMPLDAGGAGVPRLYAWGKPLSTSTSAYEYHGPTVVSGVPGPVESISASNAVSYALTRKGEVWAWGAGQFGGLGNGKMPMIQREPVRVKFPRGVKIISLPYPMPYDAGLAIDSTGHIWGWGYNYQTPLCLARMLVLVPARLPFAHVTMASGAGFHALYYSNKHLYACGGNMSGELGDRTTVAAEHPVRVVGLPAGAIKELTSSWEDSGALMADGSFYDWGYNQGDQLGNGMGIDSNIPLHVTLPAPVAQVSMGGSMWYNGQTAALLTNGSVWVWGDDQFGQLGNGETIPNLAPVRVDVPKGVRFVQVNSGGSAMYGIDHSGQVWAWGVNNIDQLGLRNIHTSDRPIRVGVRLTEISSTASNVEGLLK